MSRGDKQKQFGDRNVFVDFYLLPWSKLCFISVKSEMCSRVLLFLCCIWIKVYLIFHMIWKTTSLNKFRFTQIQAFENVGKKTNIFYIQFVRPKNLWWHFKSLGRTSFLVNFSLCLTYLERSVQLIHQVSIIWDSKCNKLFAGPSSALYLINNSLCLFMSLMVCLSSPTLFTTDIICVYRLHKCTSLICHVPAFVMMCLTYLSWLHHLQCYTSLISIFNTMHNYFVMSLSSAFHSFFMC